MRAPLVSLALLAATVGAAHAEAQELGVIVGRGARVSTVWRPPMLRFEVGMVEQRTRIGATTGHDDAGPTGILPAGGAIAARGVTVRTLLGFRGIYLGIETSVGAVREAPVVVAPAVERMVEGGSSPTRDLMFDVRGPIGVERRYGRLMLGGEVALGIGAVTLGAGPAPTDPFVSDLRVVFDARARAGVWLTRHLNVSALAGISIVRSDEHSLALVVGGALFPWDGVP
jgi:hypothetical protein